MKNVNLLVALFFLGNVFSQKCLDCPKLYEEGEYSAVIQKVAEMADKAAYDDLVFLAKSYQMLGMQKDAIGAYSHILLNDENNLEALVAVGALFIDMEQYDNALFAIDKALQVDAKNERAKYNKAVVYYYQKDFASLNKFVAKELKDNEKNTDLLFVRAMAEIDSKDFELAIKTFSNIEAIEANKKNYLFFYGYALYKLNSFEKAKKVFNKSLVNKDEQEIDTYYYMAQIYVQEDKKLEACEAYTKAINLGDITITKEADAYCKAKKAKKFKLKDRGVRATF